MTERTEVQQKLLDLYDRYAHGLISRRQFFERAKVFAVGGLTVAAVVESVMPRYAEAQQIREGDDRVTGERIEYPSPQGAGTMGAYLVRPANAAGKLPGVLVIHENRGLNPHIADVARRTALEGYLALAPDALFPLGGYPGNDDDGRALQRQRDRDEMAEDFAAAIHLLQAHPDCTGRVGCMGFCFGGSMTNLMAVRIADLAAAVPFYGGQPAVDEADKINAPLLLHFGELDARAPAGPPTRRRSKPPARPTPPTSTRAPTTAFTTTPRHATTRWQQSSPGSGRWSSWPSTCAETLAPRRPREAIRDRLGSGAMRSGRSLEATDGVRAGRSVEGPGRSVSRRLRLPRAWATANGACAEKREREAVMDEHR